MRGKDEQKSVREISERRSYSYSTPPPVDCPGASDWRYREDIKADDIARAS